MVKQNQKINERQPTDSLTEEGKWKRNERKMRTWNKKPSSEWNMNTSVENEKWKIDDLEKCIRALFANPIAFTFITSTLHSFLFFSLRFYEFVLCRSQLKPNACTFRSRCQWWRMEEKCSVNVRFQQNETNYTDNGHWVVPASATANEQFYFFVSNENGMNIFPSSSMVLFAFILHIFFRINVPNW